MDIEHRRFQTVKQINDMLTYFGKVDAIVKLQLLCAYCSSAVCMALSYGTCLVTTLMRVVFLADVP